VCRGSRRPGTTGVCGIWNLGKIHRPSTMSSRVEGNVRSLAGRSPACFAESREMMMSRHDKVLIGIAGLLALVAMIAVPLVARAA